MKKPWYEHMWIVFALYLTLGFFNILLAWLGMLCFIIPLVISAVKGSKSYCNKYCGRGQLFSLLGKNLPYQGISPCPDGWYQNGSDMVF